MRGRNNDPEIFRLAIIGALLAILGDIIDLLILYKEFSRGSRQQDDTTIIEPFLFQSRDS